jgi:predicted RNase H-like nuclease (RuvC/YqgF family)
MKRKSRYEEFVDQLKAAKQEYNKAFWAHDRDAISAALKKVHALEDRLKRIDKLAATGFSEPTGNYQGKLF